MHVAASAALTPAKAPLVCDVDAFGGGAGFALLQGLAHADDGGHAVLVHRLELEVHRLVGLTEQLPPFRVPDDHVLHLQLGQHRGCDLAGERALVLPVAVLRPELDPQPVRFDQGLQRAQVGEGRADHDVARVVVGLVEPVGELLHHLDGDEVVVVHLPVARDHGSPFGSH